jgi:hypothetical protein
LFEVAEMTKQIVRTKSSLALRHCFAATIALSLVPPIARADVYCTLSNFQVDAYDHGGVYLHGTFNGTTSASFINICGQTAGTQDCNSKATDRRVAVALAAQAQGKNLLMWFFGAITQCSQVTPYTVANTLIISP